MGRGKWRGWPIWCGSLTPWAVLVTSAVFWFGIGPRRTVQCCWLRPSGNGDIILWDFEVKARRKLVKMPSAVNALSVNLVSWKSVFTFTCLYTCVCELSTWWTAWKRPKQEVCRQIYDRWRNALDMSCEISKCALSLTRFQQVPTRTRAWAGCNQDSGGAKIRWVTSNEGGISDMSKRHIKKGNTPFWTWNGKSFQFLRKCPLGLPGCCPHCRNQCSPHPVLVSEVRGELIAGDKSGQLGTWPLGSVKRAAVATAMASSTMAEALRILLPCVKIPSFPSRSDSSFVSPCDGNGQ